MDRVVVKGLFCELKNLSFIALHSFTVRQTVIVIIIIVNMFIIIIVIIIIIIIIIISNIIILISPSSSFPLLSLLWLLLS